LVDTLNNVFAFRTFPSRNKLKPTLGIFLRLAVRDPSTHRSLISVTAWSSFAHAAVMGVQPFQNWVARGKLIGSVVLALIGVALIALAPAKRTVH
jgi:hypothetical protein